LSDKNERCYFFSLHFYYKVTLAQEQIFQRQQD